MKYMANIYAWYIKNTLSEATNYEAKTETGLGENE